MGRIFGISDLPVSAIHSPFQGVSVTKPFLKCKKVNRGEVGRMSVTLRTAKQYTKNVRQYVKRVIK